jgi:hypothetical protein
MVGATGTVLSARKDEKRKLSLTLKIEGGVRHQQYAGFEGVALGARDKDE